jgi:HAE1 family hydrophobic/amphiphilic exporter-1
MEIGGHRGAIDGMAFLIVFGAISFGRIGISQYPDVDMPTVNVSISLAGASPEVMEMNVIEPLEDSLMSLEGIEGISSSSKSGSANITVEFNIDRNIDAALQEVQTRVSAAQRKLPKDIDPPIISSTPADLLFQKSLQAT